MSINPTAAPIFPLFFFFFFMVPLLVTCSKRPYAPEDFWTLESTLQSISEFGAELKRVSDSASSAGLGECLAVKLLDKELCLKYLIGSVAVFGRVDKRDLNTISRLHYVKEGPYIWRLLKKLVRRNNVDTVAQFAADKFWSEAVAGPFQQLMKENWNAMEELTMKTLAVLKSMNRRQEHYSLLRQLPSERQYEMVRTGEMTVDMIGDIYGDAGPGPMLREMFFLARCSRDPDPEVRACIADKFPFFKQSLAEKQVVNSIEDPCPGHIATLNEDVLRHISRFMDIETVVYVMPLVCRTWRNLYWRIMMEDTRVHELYLLDLDRTYLYDIHTMTPWKWCLHDGASVLKYFGGCIVSGTLGNIAPTRLLTCNLKEYLRAVMEGRTFLPRFEDCNTPCEALVRLLEMVYGHCESYTLVFDKPVFLTSEEYEHAIHHLVYEKRWILRLPESLIIDNMPRLFSIIKEDEKLMEELVTVSTSSFGQASLGLIVCGQTKGIPEKLARLIFSHVSLFEKLVEPKAVACSEYYNSIIEFGILPGVMTYYRDDVAALPQFLVSIILSFKDSPEKIDRIEASIASEFTGCNNRKLQKIKRCLEEVPFENLMAAEGYSTEDFEFFRGVMVRCGLL